MSDVLSRAKAHYDRLRGQSIDVPEWGEDGKPLKVYFDPITARQAQRIQTRAKGSEALATVLAVICHAKDADGKPIFEDTPDTAAAFLNEVDPRVYARIGQAILGAGQDESGLGE